MKQRRSKIKEIKDRCYTCVYRFTETETETKLTYLILYMLDYVRVVECYSIYRG